MEMLNDVFPKEVLESFKKSGLQKWTCLINGNGGLAVITDQLTAVRPLSRGELLDILDCSMIFPIEQKRFIIASLESNPDYCFILINEAIFDENGSTGEVFAACYVIPREEVGLPAMV